MLVLPATHKAQSGHTPKSAALCVWQVHELGQLLKLDGLTKAVLSHLTCQPFDEPTSQCLATILCSMQPSQIRVALHEPDSAIMSELQVSSQQWCCNQTHCMRIGAQAHDLKCNDVPN